MPVLLDTPPAVDSFLASIAGAPLLALDTEGASFHRYFDKVWLVQLATQDEAGLLDPAALRAGTAAHQALGSLLQRADVEVVIHDGSNDLKMLHADFGFAVKQLFDTRIAAQLLGIQAIGLASLLDVFLGVKLSKKEQKADWSMRPLTPSMLAYAAEDTAHLLRLKDHLQRALEEKGRMDWLREECAAVAAVKVQADADERRPAFLRISGAAALSRPRLTLLRELVAWREDIAKERDKAPFRIIGNEQLLAIAQQPPAAVTDLQRVRGVSPALVAQRGQELVDLVAQVRALPEASWASFPREHHRPDPVIDTRTAKLKSVRDATAVRLGIDPGFLCGRSTLEKIAAINPRTEDALASTSALHGLLAWKRKEMGAALVRALAGT